MESKLTVKELIDLLEQYPDDAEVFVLRERESGMFGGKMMDVGLTWIIDQDTAKGSVCLCSKQKLEVNHE